jgi:hypothetical protein
VPRASASRHFLSGSTIAVMFFRKIRLINAPAAAGALIRRACVALPQLDK